MQRSLTRITPSAAAFTAGLAFVLASAHAGYGAATPEQACLAGKADGAGRYSSCLGKAEKSLALTGDTTKYAAAVLKCQEKIETSYQKLEATAEAKGTTCPSTGDVSTVQDFLDGCTAGVVDGVSGGSLPPDPQACGEDLEACEAEPRARPLKTGQVNCYNNAGTAIPCTGTGQDGETQNGEDVGFVDNGDGTITDTSSGLMWEKLADDGGVHDYNTGYNWTNAFGKIGTLNAASFGGYDDWRLPSVRELLTIVNFGVVNPAAYSPFSTNCTPGCTLATCSCTSGATAWTSSSFQLGATSAWLVDFYAGGTGNSSKTNSATVRAVRDAF
ncbi:MAG TPA: DUF1566 domain-containing protein [Candidatus Binatia bacterium]|nr:DUF1566 domain-containing protein [Candidatus Binatia bacterium]